jgi:(p)ppGpp synthase/HD superfamily hydrolase
MTSNQACLLSKAIEIAAREHRCQVDKRGEAYILHPLRVMARVETPEEKMVAALHDVIEDTGLPLKELTNEGFPEEVVTAIDCLTRRHYSGLPEPYLDSFIERVKGNPLALRVKLADLEDNMDPARVPADAAGHESMLRKYQRAKDKLLAVLEVQRLEKQLKKARELL